MTVLSLGLFYFVVNGLAFGLAAALVPGFRVDGLWPAILGAIVVSLVSGRRRFHQGVGDEVSDRIGAAKRLRPSRSRN